MLIVIASPVISQPERRRGHGPVFHGEVPEVESLPGAPFASVNTINVKTGSAYKQGKKTYYYGTMPTKCPKHYLPIKTELTFYRSKTSSVRSFPNRTSRRNTTRPAPSGK